MKGTQWVLPISLHMQALRGRNLPRKLQQVSTFTDEVEEVENTDKPAAPQYKVCVEGDSQFFGLKTELVEGFADGIWVYSNGRC